MRPEYRAWIETFVREHRHLKTLCGYAVRLMVGAFPELIPVPGHVTLIQRHRREAVEADPQLLFRISCAAERGDWIHTQGTDFGFERFGGGEHWWARTKQGAIVDPTALQFWPARVRSYHPWPADRPIPTGKCPNCGELCYESRYLCSKSCEREYAAYVEGGLGF